MLSINFWRFLFVHSVKSSSLTKVSLVSTIFWDWTDFNIKFCIFCPLYDGTWPEFTKNFIFETSSSRTSMQVSYCVPYEQFEIWLPEPLILKIWPPEPQILKIWPQFFFLNYSPKFSPQFDLDLNSFNDFWALTSFIGLFCA